MITPTIVLVGLSAAMPVAAQGGSLLSGYGGPGQGNQAILGSSLLNGGGGPKNGGGGGGGSENGGGSAGTGVSSTVGAGNTHAQAVRGGKGSVASRHASTTAGRGKQATGRVGGASGRVSQVYPASARGAGAGKSETLGISGEDLMYMLLALCGLIFTGLLTRRMARTTAASGHG
jgi:hypothetical protein